MMRSLMRADITRLQMMHTNTRSFVRSDIRRHPKRAGLARGLFVYLRCRLPIGYGLGKVARGSNALSGHGSALSANVLRGNGALS